MDQVSHKRAVEREILLFMSTDGGIDSVFYESSWLGLHLKSGGKFHFLTQVARIEGCFALIC